ncbi:MAG: hypothetical protein JWM27_2843, partial [Gemmatimonadetes bacterium]|nr:hypothetical protein [Gemmatimonadota bacterium]
GAAPARRGGDATLADAVRDIRLAAGRPRATLGLARGHAAYGAARAAYRQVDYSRADSLFAAADTVSGQSEPLRAWMTVERAAARGSNDSVPQGLALIRPQVARTDSARYPGLAARAEWIQGTLLSKADSSADALPHYEAAARLFARARDEEGRGIAEYLAGEVQRKMGRPEGLATLHRGLRRLRPYRGFFGLKNAVDVTAGAAAEMKLPHAAVRLGNESVTLGGTIGLPVYQAESFLTRARWNHAAGDDAKAGEDLDAAKRSVDGIADGSVRTFMNALWLYTRATLNGDTDPAAAVRDLSAALPGLATRPVLVQRARLARARIRLRGGDTDAAVADLDWVLAAIGANRRARTGSAPVSPSDDPAPLVELVVRRLADLHRDADALALLERHRMVLAPVGPYDPSRLRAIRSARPGSTVVRVAVIGDSVYVWALSNHTLRLARPRVAAAEVERTVRRVRAELAGGREDSVPYALARLYDWLLRPVESALGGPGRELVILADGPLAGVPWSALPDRRTGRPLVRDHPVRLGSGIADAWTPLPPTPAAPGGPVLLVADPAFDPRDDSLLARLPGARGEVDALRRIYPGAAVLQGAAATRAAVAADLRNAVVVHFAGHAVADSTRPDRSYLVLAPGPRGESGHLAAADLDALPAGGIRLVVLSACETQGGGRAGAAQLAGLSGAFLGAGARAVIGSLWPVRDDATRALMVAFHRRYAATGDAAASLRGAQLEMLASPNPRYRSPASWAAFQLAGR